jgi:hypothetical protein
VHVELLTDRRAHPVDKVRYKNEAVLARTGPRQGAQPIPGAHPKPQGYRSDEATPPVRSRVLSARYDFAYTSVTTYDTVHTFTVKVLCKEDKQPERSTRSHGIHMYMFVSVVFGGPAPPLG